MSEETRPAPPQVSVQTNFTAQFLYTTDAVTPEEKAKRDYMQTMLNRAKDRAHKALRHLTIEFLELELQANKMKG